MVEGIDVDWTQVAAFLTALAVTASGFAWVVRRIVSGEFDKLRKDLNGALDARIDARIDAKISPQANKIDHIDSELARHLQGYEGYRRAS